MKDIPLGHVNTLEIMPEERHTASAVGNIGVNVVSTPSLIGFLEQTSHRAILPFVEDGEVSVGTRVEVDHLAAAYVGQMIQTTARIAAVEGRRITFEVEARQGDKLVMKGRHGRAIVSRERLLGKKRGP
ncbi:MAG TPA: hotdog domain-containing protein [Stellaceae bacterium]|nr:hotdog domain-containing protein [Stellaceae bacterium]